MKNILTNLIRPIVICTCAAIMAIIAAGIATIHYDITVTTLSIIWFILFIVLTFVINAAIPKLHDWDDGE